MTNSLLRLNPVFFDTAVLPSASILSGPTGTSDLINERLYPKKEDTERGDRPWMSKTHVVQWANLIFDFANV